MPAKIIVRRGKKSEEQHWIEDEVSRIGSAADCTVVIRGIPPHCLTLLYRKGQYSVVNRSSQAIDVEGEPLLPMATVPINGGEGVSIGSGTVLQLDIDGDPAPSRRPRSVVDPNEGERHESDEEVVPNAKQTAKRYVLLTVAFLAGFYLFFGDTLSGGGSDLSTSREFHQVVDYLQSNASDSDDGPARICRAVQRARISEIRGDLERAVAY